MNEEPPTAKHSPTTAAEPSAHPSADALEEANASLVARIAELEQELTAARAVGTSAVWATTQSLDDAEVRVRELEAKLVDAEAQRDAERTRAEQLLAEEHDLRAQLERRAFSPEPEQRRTRRALEIDALVRLHSAGLAAGVKDERALSAALRLGAELCDDVELSASAD